MKKIMALVDNSIYGASVCDYAGWIASREESSLTLLHVLGRRDTSGDKSNLSGSIGLGARTSLLEELAELDGQKARLINKRGRAILDDARERAANMGASKITVMLRHGRLLEAMEEFETEADLIVLGKRGDQSGENMENLGLNLKHVVRLTSKPVMVASRAFWPVNKLLIAFDGGTKSIKAVEHIVGSPVFQGVECFLMMAGRASKSKRKALAGAVAALREAGFTADSSVVEGQVEDVVASAVESEGFDLLVMGAYSHSRIRNIIIGSTTSKMMNACKVPILLFF